MTNSKQAENYGKNADRFPEMPGFIDFLFKKPQKCNKFGLWYNNVGIMLLQIRMIVLTEKGG